MQFGLDLKPHHRVFCGFFLFGTAVGSLLTRVGDIQISMGVGQAALGLALVGTAVGMMISVTLLSPMLESFGFKRVMIAGVPAMGLLFAFAATSPNPAVLFFWLLASGLAAGAANTVINVEADRTENLTGRRIMNRCHALFSGGFLFAALIGATAKQMGVAPVPHLIGVTAMLVAGVLLSWGRFTPAPARTLKSDAAAPKFAVPSPAILLLGVFVLAAMIYEGAAADWAVIYMRDVFGMEPFINGMALAFGSTAQALSRFYSDRFVERYGPASVATFMLALLGLGAVVTALAPFWGLALVGFALMGTGTAVIVPLAISAAARRQDRPAAINVAALTQLAWIAFFTGPPLIGFVAEHFGSRLTFGVGLPLVALSLILARKVLGEAPESGRG